MVHPIVGVILILGFLFINPKVNAQVVINEVSPITSPEWVEIYNIGLEKSSLKDYSINFGSDTQNLIFCDEEKIEANEYKIIELSSSWLANTGDVVTLKRGDDEVDKIGYGTGYNLAKPDSILKYLTRFPDGSSNWVLADQSTKQGSSISFNCPSIAPNPTPPPSQIPYKAVYKINKPKDSNGIDVLGVQIFVDGGYIHHEDDEVIEFYNGHECYSEIICNLGTHTISLRKNGYNSWEDTQNFSAGTNIEASPVMDKLDTPSPTPTATTTPIPTVTPKPTPTKTPISTGVPASASAVLGIRENISESPNPTSAATKDNKERIPILPFILIVGGLCFIAVPIFSIIRNGKKGTEVP